MKKAIILLILLATVAAIGQTCANGREKKGIFDDVCANGYYLNVDSCCTESLVVPFYVVVIDSLDSLPIPWPWPDTTYPCTVFVASDTLVIKVFDTLLVYDTLVISSVDTLWVMGSNGMWFYADKEYVCDSVPTSWAADSSESTWCPWCDSIMTVTWFQVTEDGDEIIYDIWRQILIHDGDTCGVVQNAGDVYNYEITYCYDCDTNIYINYGDVYNNYNTGVYVVDSVTGITYGPTDTVWLHEHAEGSTGSSGGIWVRDCDCDTTAYGIPDTLDAFLAIDSTWSVVWNNDRDHRVRCNALNVIDAGYMQSRSTFTLAGPRLAANVKMVNHGGYADSLLGFLDNHWLREDTLLWDGEYVAARQVFFACGDTSVGRPNGLWTRKPSDYTDCATDWNNERPGGVPSVAFYESAVAMGFYRTINFNDWYSEGEIAALNEAQPDWMVITFSDDFMPWMFLDREDYDLDVLATTGERLGAGAFAYRITPPEAFDYSVNHKIGVGLYSCQSPYIGGQVLFSLIMPDTVSSCYTKRDSITLPECYDCADTFCIKYPQGYSPPIAGYEGLQLYEDTVICYSVCDPDTMFWGMGLEFSWGAFRLMSSDSVDTFEISTYNDSVVISDKDGDGDPLIINMPTIQSQDLKITKGNSLSLLNESGLERANLYASNDSVFIGIDTAGVSLHFDILTYIDSLISAEVIKTAQLQTGNIFWYREGGFEGEITDSLYMNFQEDPSGINLQGRFLADSIYCPSFSSNHGTPAWQIHGADSLHITSPNPIQIESSDIILDGTVKDPSGNSFLPFWMSGDTLYFEVGDSTWVVVRDSIFVTP